MTATTTVEAIQGFVHVRARRRGRSDAADLAHRYITLLSPLLEPHADDLRAGLDLYEEHDDLGAFDAVLVAVARRAGASAVVSADRGFAVVDAPVVLDPAADGFLDEVAELD